MSRPTCLAISGIIRARVVVVGPLGWLANMASSISQYFFCSAAASRALAANSEFW
jgi:hypothetical protein